MMTVLIALRRNNNDSMWNAIQLTAMDETLHLVVIDTTKIFGAVVAVCVVLRMDHLTTVGCGRKNDLVRNL